MRYTLRQLEVFLAVAQLGNLTKAAKQLAMSQSAASSALKELEQQFELQLFDRRGKRLLLNQQGQHLRSKAEHLMAMAEEFEQDIAMGASSGTLQVGATMSIGNYLAVNLLAEYTRLYPSSQITLDVENTAHIANRIVNYELDIGLVEGELNHPKLDVIPWCQDELVIFCSPDHPYAQLSNALSDDQLTDSHWILREQGSGTRQAFERSMQELLPAMQISLELQHTEAIKRAVAANLGLGCLSVITLADDFQRGNLVRLTVANRDLSRQLYFILNKQKFHSASTKAWIDLCRQHQTEFLHYPPSSMENQ